MKKIVQGFIALILAGILAAGVCCMGYASRNDEGKWFKNFKNLSEWHWSDNQEPEEPKNEDEDEADGKNLVMTLSDDYAEMTLVPFVNATNSKTVTITATVEPETAENKEVYFTLALKDGSSATQYMSMSVAGNAATLTCLKAFPVQIILTATAVGNSKLIETCTFDYLAGVSDVEFKYEISEWANVYSHGDGSIYLKPVFGTGTIVPVDFQVNSLFFELSNEFTTQIRNNSFYRSLISVSSGSEIDLKNDIHLNKYYPAKDNITLSGEWYIVTTDNTLNTFFMSDEQSPILNGNALQYALAAFKQTARATSDNLRIGVTWQANYNGEIKGSIYYTDYMTINAEDIDAGLIDGNGINLDKNNVIFGDI